MEKSPFDLLVDQIRAVVREEIASALEKKRPPKLQFTTKETSQMLGVPESWLSAKARDGEIPCRMLGHYRFFTHADIEKILELHPQPACASVKASQNGGADNGKDEKAITGRDNE